MHVLSKAGPDMPVRSIKDCNANGGETKSEERYIIYPPDPQPMHGAFVPGRAIFHGYTLDPQVFPQVSFAPSILDHRRDGL